MFPPFNTNPITAPIVGAKEPKPGGYAFYNGAYRLRMRLTEYRHLEIITDAGTHYLSSKWYFSPSKPASSKKPGYDLLTASAPFIRTGDPHREDAAAAIITIL